MLSTKPIIVMTSTTRNSSETSDVDFLKLRQRRLGEARAHLAEREQTLGRETEAPREADIEAGDEQQLGEEHGVGPALLQNRLDDAREQQRRNRCKAKESGNIADGAAMLDEIADFVPAVHALWRSDAKERRRLLHDDFDGDGIDEAGEQRTRENDVEKAKTQQTEEQQHETDEKTETLGENERMLGCNLNGGTKESGNECVGTNRELSRVAHEGVDEDGPKGGVQAVDWRHAGK
jgi:hypothetical protein